MAKVSGRHFKLPKFKKGDHVITPDGPGVIAVIQGDGGTHWYAVFGTAAFYTESELQMDVKKV